MEEQYQRLMTEAGKRECPEGLLSMAKLMEKHLNKNIRELTTTRKQRPAKETKCYVCQHPAQADGVGREAVLLCDGKMLTKHGKSSKRKCESEAHAGCVNLDKPPDGEWYCKRLSLCSSADRSRRKQGRKRALDDEEDEDEDEDEEDEDEDEEALCKVCKKSAEADAEGPLKVLECRFRSCGAEVHLECAELTSVPKGNWFCTVECRTAYNNTNTTRKKPKQLPR